MLRFYSLIISFAVWSVLLPFYLLKFISGKSSWEEITQRMAWIRSNKPNQSQTIIIHAVSYGEMIAAGPIISSLIDKNPNLEVILTTGNRDGMIAARSLRSRYPNIVRSMFLPWDRAQAMTHWLSTLEPALVVMVETEIWPNLIASCGNLKIPVRIVNGRIYPGDVARYGLIRSFMKSVFRHIGWIGVQDEYEYQRFLTIGAPEEILEVVGNVKFDQFAPAGTGDSTSLTSMVETDTPLLLAGSTHAPEEKIILETFRVLKVEFPDLQLILAPRKVSRADKVEKLANRHDFRLVRCSALEANSSFWDVLIVDELGWLTSLYGIADIVFIGGSLVNHGGHNLLEAAAHGKAILVGPYMQHFQGIVEKFDGKNALVRLNGKSDLGYVLKRLLANPTERLKMGKMALTIVLDNRGCTQRYAQILNELLVSVK